MRRFLCTIILSLFCLSVVFAADSRYAAHSALSSGRWVKVSVDANGVYKLTESQLKQMGFQDFSKVSVCGYGGWPQSETLTGDEADDVPQVAVYRGNGYILFYGKGTVKWEYGKVGDTETFVHTNNPYSTLGYYFITDALPVNDMKTEDSVDGAVRKITTFDDYSLWEKELVSVNTSGRDLFGESFQMNPTQTFSMNIPGITADDAIVSFRFISKTSSRTSVSVEANSTTVISTSIAGPSSSSTESYTAARSVTSAGRWQGEKSEDVKLTVNFGATGNQNTYLDYIRVQSKRALKQYGNSTFFRSLDARNNVSSFVIADATASTVVFDITDAESPKIMSGSLSGSEYSFSIKAESTLREFVAVEADKLTATPTVVGEIEAQDLHGLEQTDMVIIVPKAFQTEAERLAEFHKEKDGLKVTVINPELIYNEFSSGTPDATAYRRFMKMFYDRKTSDDDAPKYLLLFGDGAYDNRGLTQEWKNQQSLLKNMLLTYQSENSLDIDSYTTDDYFGFLKDNTETFYAPTAELCLGIGRFPIRTNAEAKAAVDKVVNYTSDASWGDWKTNLCFMADDGSNADKYTTLHMDQSNQLTDIVNTNRPEFNISKLFFDAYKKDRTGGNASYPDVKNALQKQLKNGVFLLNYTGHGGTEALSDEKVITKSDIVQASYEHLPLWITATCDFTRFDAMTTSAGEEVFLNEKSGGIALYTTTRVVMPGPNFRLNKALIEHLFAPLSGKRYTLGEVMKETKLSSTLRNDANKLNFVLIGDPALTLAYSNEQIKVTEINGQLVSDLSEPVQLKALSKVTLKGEVQSFGGEKIQDFNGLVNLSVLDSKVTLTTLDNNNTGTTFQYTDYPNTIYIGADSARNGSFTFNFTVPKDISYSNDAGKMIFYASDEAKSRDAQGVFQEFIVGGTSDDAGEDNQGPDIRYLYLNDTTFVDGGKVNTTPLFVACVWDKNGVNVAGSGLGHDMVLTIDNSPFNSYVLNDYYQVLPEGDGSGLIVFSIPELEAGVHTAELKVWDVYNNSTTQTFTFEVVEDLKPELINLTAGPIPARDQIRFFLKHNRPESQMTITIQVFDMAGRLMWNHEETGSSDLFDDYVITWDLCANGGTRLRAGVYLYRVCMTSGKSAEVTAAKKLIILAQ